MEEKSEINEDVISIIQRSKLSDSISCLFLIRFCLHQLQKLKETKCLKEKLIVYSNHIFQNGGNQKFPFKWVVNHKVPV